MRRRLGGLLLCLACTLCAPPAASALPGVPLYRAFGFVETGRFTLTMPDGVAVECAAMERAIEPGRR